MAADSEAALQAKPEVLDAFRRLVAVALRLYAARPGAPAEVCLVFDEQKGKPNNLEGGYVVAIGKVDREAYAPKPLIHVTRIERSDLSASWNAAYFLCLESPPIDDAAWPGQPPSQLAGSSGRSADSVPKPLTPWESWYWTT